MRIIAGEFRGRRLDTPPGSTTRPTTDRVREAIMGSLESRLGGFAGVRVLDAFAGSGGLGLEAMSRGAEHVVFFENDRRALEILRKNIATLGVNARATVIPGDAFALAGRGMGMPFSLILLDPPYTLVQDRMASFVQRLAAGGTIETGALVSLEHAASDLFSWPEGYELVQSKRYGTIAVDVAEFVWEGSGQ